MSGVSPDAVTARDFIMVRAKLVREVGGANEALVWARIFYRVGPDSAAAREVSGERWWPASYDQLAAETGLTPKQVRGAVERLVEGGFVVRARHAAFDRTTSYRPVLHLPSGANGDAPEGSSQLPRRADVPLAIDLEDVKRASAPNATDEQLRFLADSHTLLTGESASTAEWGHLTVAEADVEIKQYWAEIRAGGRGLIEDRMAEDALAALSPLARDYAERVLAEAS